MFSFLISYIWWKNENVPAAATLSFSTLLYLASFSNFFLFLILLPFYSQSLSLISFPCFFPSTLYYTLLFSQSEVLKGGFVIIFSPTPVCRHFLPAENNSLWIRLSQCSPVGLIFGSYYLKSSYRDLCWICRWHRFKATSREPAGCFTLQINLTTRRIIVQGRRAGAWTPSWALCCLVIYHNLTTLVLMLLPSGDEGFLFHSGHPSACDIDCCHIIL